jgi:Xaa-Pro aminopeptidase
MLDISFGQYAYDWREGINLERLRKERLEKAREAMKKYGIDAMILMKADNVRYTTSTITPPWMMAVPGWRYALVAKDHPPILWEHGDISHITREECPWLGKVKFSYTWIRGQETYLRDCWEYVAKLWAEDLMKELKELGIKDGVIGMDVREELAVKALKNLGIEVVDCQRAMVDARLIKTKDEINCLRMAAAICEIMFEEAKRMLKPGVREIDIVALGHKIGWEHGMDDITGFTVCSGPNTWPNRKFYTDRIIRPGDLVTFDIGGAGYMGYKTCYYRTFKVGAQPTVKEKEFYDVTVEQLRSAERMIKPGVTTKEVVEKSFRTAKELWGYESEFEAIANQWGHGLGLALYEPPMFSWAFSPMFPFELKENMTFALETQHGSPKEGGVRVEDMYVVTSTGVERLSKYPRDEIIVV